MFRLFQLSIKLITVMFAYLIGLIKLVNVSILKFYSRLAISVILFFVRFNILVYSNRIFNQLANYEFYFFATRYTIRIS